MAKFYLQTKVSTLICDSKLLKKVASVSSSLETIQNVVYFESDNTEALNAIGDWQISSFSEVEKMGQKSPVKARLPIKKDIAIIMYTSGSTGLPKVRFFPYSLISSYISIIYFKGVWICVLELFIR